MGAKRGGWFQKMLGRGWVDPEEAKPAPPALRDNETEVLQFDGKDVRTIWIKGEQWWVATDVCAVIEIANARDAVAGLDDDEKGRVANPDAPTSGGHEFLNIVNEPGLYHLLGKSSKAKAKEFWRWVRHDVLPSIRRTGSYSVDQTPIRPWIKKVARKHGHSSGWQKDRQTIADGNRAADSETFAIGGDAMACSSRYNSVYMGLFRRTAKGLKKWLGCRDKDSPLNQMADGPLSLYGASNNILLQKMKEGSITVDNLTEQAETIGKAFRKTALDLLGPDHDFGVTEDQKGNKILDTVQKQIS